MMDIREEKVAVVGIGYVGLPVACIFAEQGFRTVGIDIIGERVDKINLGLCPIGGEEPGLAELLRDVVERSLLSASTDMVSISDADMIVVCVDTPVNEEKKPVLKNLESAVKDIARHMKEGALVSIESTIPPGTMERIVIPVLEQHSGRLAGEGFNVVHCPERVMPGRLLANLREYKRVLGGFDKVSIKKAMIYYSTFVEEEIIPTTLVNAEICKTGENAYRDVQIAFANEMALICEKLGANVYEVRDLINSCPFRDMHIPGSGVGGYCLPKDSWLLLGNVDSDIANVITSARIANERMPQHLAELAREELSSLSVKKAKVSVMGLSFIRDSDDTRNSPAKEIIKNLSQDFEIIAHDPFVTNMDGVLMTASLEEALVSSDCAIFVTDHSCYQNIQLRTIKEWMRTPIVIDGRNIFDSKKMSAEGITYRAIGKGKRL